MCVCVVGPFPSFHELKDEGEKKEKVKKGGGGGATSGTYYM